MRLELVHLRHEVITAAAKNGKQIAAADTHPFSDWDQQQITPKERYQTLMEDYQQLTRELVIFGCHVHVGISDRSSSLPTQNCYVWTGKREKRKGEGIKT
ncbi:MAG: glutamate-cysteine ligase family protein [Nostoc sp. DedSLP03]|uniref:glutamate-cysteine ligase family protein n=1 Tax=Nostoc sp. DedSLP03 TaxID=3075400 RepID=UPI002AD2F05A|nr:glutamate-cysteine ligase family protein [Nostoc sp. DedSLP03]MDZ7967798.1 glutamate-cysteine ligase family protein [Nostoc sp. DedSLP03]